MPTKNIDKQREYRRKWYHRNKIHARQSIEERQRKLEEWFNEYRSSLKCEHCGENHIATLDFHHKDPDSKDIAVTRAVTNGWQTENTS